MAERPEPYKGQVREPSELVFGSLLKTVWVAEDPEGGVFLEDPETLTLESGPFFDEKDGRLKVKVTGQNPVDARVLKNTISLDSWGVVPLPDGTWSELSLRKLE